MSCCITCVPVPEGARLDPFPADDLRVATMLLAEGEVRVACVDAKTFRPRPLPEFIKLLKEAPDDGQ